MAAARRKPSEGRHHHHDDDQRFRRAVLHQLREIAFVMDDVHARLGRLERADVRLRQEVTQLGEETMVNLDKLVQETEEQSSVVESTLTLLKGLRDEIAASAGDQSKIDAIVAQLDAQNARLAAAVSQSDDVEEPTPVDPAPADGGDTGGETPAPTDPAAGDTSNAMGDEGTGPAGRGRK